MDRIHIEGIEFHGFHGVPEAERVIGHRYRVDVILELDLRRAGETDDLGLTIDYGAAAQCALEIGTGASVQLVETLAERMAAALLARFKPVSAVEVRVAKLRPPVPLPIEACAIQIRRGRQDA